MSTCAAHSANSSVLIVGNFLSKQRGTRFYCEDLAKQLAATGCKVLTTSNRGNRTARLVDMAWTAIRQRHAYEVATVDVYSGAGFYLAAALLLLLRFLGKTNVAILHGGNLLEFHRRHPWQVATLLSATSVVVTPSKYLFNYFQSHRADIEYLPNGMDLINYKFTHRVKVAPRICWLRAFDEAYDPLLAVHTLALVRKRIPDAVLSMVGPVRRQELFDKVTNEAASLGLEQAVTFVGAITKQDVPAVLAAHDIFLNTTTAESFGVAVMEAAACGLPIVSTAVGEIPYLWTHGTDALLVPSGDAKAMASAVNELFERPGLAGKLSLNARAKSEAYDWRVIVPQWLELLQVQTLDRNETVITKGQQ